MKTAHVSPKVMAGTPICKSGITAFKFLTTIALVFTISSCHSRQNGSGQADSNTVSNTETGAPVVGGTAKNDQDRDMDFAKDAAIGGLMEVELGKYAQQNAMNPRVRKFGAMMVKDHTKANDELKTLAQQKNLNIPSSMDDKHLQMVRDIQEKKGADFDKEYMKQMVDDHEKDVDDFKKFSEKGADPDLKNFASKTLPILLMHEDSAKRIHDAIK